jgi:RNase P subunit RPR2
VKILKRGLAPESRIHNGSCRNCQTEIEFEAREAQRVNDQRAGDFLQIDCPICQHKINVYPNAIRPTL